VIEHGGDEDQAIAGLLHDVIEDCGKTVDEIVGMFGSRVAGIVEHCTDGVPDETGRKRPWQERKISSSPSTPLQVDESRL
jgi:(p)ppGpp synthase/HD superfamily hydrolase